MGAPTPYLDELITIKEKVIMKKSSFFPNKYSSELLRRFHPKMNVPSNPG